MSVEKLGELIGNSINKQESMGRDLTGRDSVSTWFLIPETRLKLRFKKFTTYTQDISGDVLIWGHPTYGLWGTSKWGTAFPNSTVLKESVNLDDSMTLTGREEIKYFLGDVSTARIPSKFAYSTGTSAYNQGRTSVAGTILGTCGSSSELNNYNLIFKGTAYNVDNGTGTVRCIGLTNSNGSVLYHYNIPLSPLEVDIDTNYYFETELKISDDSGEYNCWTNLGTTYVAEWLGGTTKTPPTHIGFGTGTASSLKTNTSLEGEFVRNSIYNYANQLAVQNTWSSTLEASDGVGEILTRTGIFTGGTADANAEMIIENKHFDITKTNLFQIDLEHKNVLN